MRSSMIALSLVFVFAMGCGGKKKADNKKNEACDAAKADAVEKWKAAEKSWDDVVKAWDDKELVKKVQKALEKKTPGAAGVEAAKKEMVTFKGYLKFKQDHTKKVLGLVKAAHTAAQGKDMRKARKAAVGVFMRAADKSAIRHNKAPWFTNPNVVTTDQLQSAAYNKLSEGKTVSKKAEETCSK